MKSRKSTSKTQIGLSVDSKLRKIINNRVSGASIIETEIINYFLKHHKFDSKSKTRKILKLIKDRFGIMANITSLLDVIEADSDTVRLFQILKNYKKESMAFKRETILKTSKIISRYKSIFTLSNSTVIREAILAASLSGWRGDVNIIESRPMNEGILLAKHLSGKSINVNLSVDSTIYDRIYDSSAVLLGADAVTEKYFVNKIGSKLAVDIAAKLNKRIFVAAEPSKYISIQYYKFQRDTNPRSEILKSSKANLSILNYYFESVKPAGRFRYIREKELLEPSKLILI